MARYIAFLRAINVGGHVVKMTHLRALFEELGFTSVETFIASGQVIFETRSTDRPKLEAKIEKHLRAALGYDVATFIRTPDDLKKIAARARQDGRTLYVCFTRKAPDTTVQAKLLSYANEIDEFEVHGSEVFWYARKTLSESNFSGALLEKILAMPASARNVNTVNRLVAKYAE